MKGFKLFILLLASILSMQNTNASSLIGDRVNFTMGYYEGTTYTVGTTVVDTSIYSTGSAIVDINSYEFFPVSSLDSFYVDIGGDSIDIIWSNTGLSDLLIDVDYLKIYDLDWDDTGIIGLESISASSSSVQYYGTTSGFYDTSRIEFDAHSVLIPLKNTFWPSSGGQINITLEPTVVPLPASLWLFLSGIISLLSIKRKDL